MKKIYYLLFLLPLMLTTSCEEDGNEVVNLKNQEPVVNVIGITPLAGYVGDQFTINVTDFGGAKDFIKAFIGENELKIISCSDAKIVVETPMDATGGKIKVKFFDKEFFTDFVYQILDKPFVENISKTWAFVDDEITFSGSSLGTKAEDIQLYFGKAALKAKVVSWANNAFTVQVPADATSGKISLNIASQKKVNIVPLQDNEFTIRKHATLTEIAPVSAYKGSKVAIKGTNLGTTIEGVKVLFGDKQGEVVSCAENAIEVKVPMDIAETKVNVTIKTYYEQVEGNLEFTVTPTPIVSDNGISALEGYTGSTITITGTKMPKNTNDMIVKFGDVVAPIKSYTETNGTGTLTVTVPDGITETVKLNFTIAGLDICSKDFKVLPSPTVDTFENKLIGTEFIISGTGFPAKTNDVTITFGEENGVHPSSISATKMTVSVPNTFTSGKLSVAFKDIPIKKEIGNVQVLRTGDVTNLVLKNSVRPFTPTTDYVSGEWAMPVGWSFTNFGGQALNFPKGDITQGLLVMQVGWGQPAKQDSKMYQVVTLPKGTYKFILNVVECGTNKGRFGVIFAVTKGNATLPNLSDQVAGHKNIWWPVDESNFFTDNLNNASFYRITDNKTPHQKELEVTLTDETEVTIGFATQLNQEGWIKLSSINVALE